MAGQGPSSRAPASAGSTIASYFEAFSPAPCWDELCSWPPDVFALTNLVLDHTEAYRFAVAPPQGRRWPPSVDWEERVRAAAAAWRVSAGRPDRDVPPSVAEHWLRLVDRLQVPLSVIRRGEQAEIWENLVTLHAMADQACQHLAADSPEAGSFEEMAWGLLERTGSLSRIDAARVRITPKSQFPSRGITIRSMSRHLALSYESVEVHWRRLRPTRDLPTEQRDLHMLLAPWPLEVRATAFRPVEGPLENMDPSAFGFFRFAPDPPLDLGLLARLIDEGRRIAERIDAVVLPEAAVPADKVEELEDLLRERSVQSVIAGVHADGATSELGRNYVHLGVMTADGWHRYEQAKHHRWCLDAAQIRQYHLGRALDPKRNWWEAIELPPRTVEILDLGNGATSAPLVCEDLARLDEVADVLRRIGPTLVVALLLDGPQLPQRWPCRYATVLADEPGSAVLTLTSLGMARRSVPPGMRRSRAVAMWNDPTSGLRPIELARGASGVLIRASAELRTVWTADGRRHEASAPSITLADVHQLRIGSERRR